MEYIYPSSKVNDQSVYFLIEQSPTLKMKRKKMTIDKGDSGLEILIGRMMLPHQIVIFYIVIHRL